MVKGCYRMTTENAARGYKRHRHENVISVPDMVRFSLYNLHECHQKLQLGACFQFSLHRCLSDLYYV